MSQDKRPPIPAKSLAYIIGCLVALAVVILLGYFPAKKEKEELALRITTLQEDIERQKVLKPLHAQLKTKIEQGRKLAESFARSQEEVAALSVNDAPQLLAEEAKKHRLPESHFSPAPESMAASDSKLLVNGYAKGGMENFRSFLMDLSTAPYYERIEHLEIQRKGGDMEYWLKLWLNLK